MKLTRIVLALLITMSEMGLAMEFERTRIASSQELSGSPRRVSRVVALAADGAGNIYMADTITGNPNHSNVYKIDPAGVRTRIASSQELSGSPRRVSHVVALAADGAGNIYMADTITGNPNHSNVYKVDPAGVRTRIASSQELSGSPRRVSHVVALATDGAGNVYMADTITGNPNHSNVYKVDPAGVRTRIASSQEMNGSPRRVSHVVALAIDGMANLYMADTITGNPNQSHVYRVDPSDKRTRVASSQELTGSDKRVSHVVALSADATGKFYMADTITGNPHHSDVYKFQEKAISVVIDPTPDPKPEPQESEKFVNITGDVLKIPKKQPVKIYDIRGKLVREVQEEIMDTRSMAPDIYIMVFPDGKRKRFAVVR